MHNFRSGAMAAILLGTIGLHTAIHREDRQSDRERRISRAPNLLLVVSATVFADRGYIAVRPVTETKVFLDGNYVVSVDETGSGAPLVPVARGRCSSRLLRTLKREIAFEPNFAEMNGVAKYEYGEVDHYIRHPRGVSELLGVVARDLLASEHVLEGDFSSRRPRILEWPRAMTRLESVRHQASTRGFENEIPSDESEDRLAVADGFE